MINTIYVVNNACRKLHWFHHPKTFWVWLASWCVADGWFGAEKTERPIKQLRSQGKRTFRQNPMQLKTRRRRCFHPSSSRNLFIRGICMEILEQDSKYLLFSCELNKPYAALAPYYKAYTAVYISSINHQQLPSVSNEFNTKREKSSIHQENMVVSYTAYIFDKLNHIYR